MLTPEVIKEAFEWFKVRFNDDAHKEYWIQSKIKPGPEYPCPTDPNYKDWKITDWAGFLYKYVKPKK